MQTRRLQSFLSAIILGLGVLLLFFALLGAVPVALARDNQSNRPSTSPLYLPPAQAGTGIVRVAITGANLPGCGSEATPCSTIQYAVDQAQSGEEIRIAAGTYTGVQGRAGVTQTVYISKSITLRGGYTVTNWTTPNAETNLTVLDALGGGRVVYVTGGINVGIENLGVTGGNATGLGGGQGSEDTGGGIYSGGPMLVLTNNHIYSNTATFGSMSGFGGGVYLDGGQATFISNSIKFNRASVNAIGSGAGGGAYIFSNPTTFTNNKFMTNTASVFNDGYGGGILGGSDGSLNLNLSGNLIIGNVGGNGPGGGSGGGIDFSAGTLSVLNLAGNIIQGNIANRGSGSGAGGGLIVSGYSVKMSGNQILSNTAAVSVTSLGGGMYLEFSSLTMEQDRVQNNAAGYGGGLYQQLDGFNQFSAVMTNVVFADNIISAGSGQNGAGMYLHYATLTGKHLTLARNSGGDGSGIYIAGNGAVSRSTLNLTNTLIVSHTVGVSVTSSLGEVNQAVLEGVLWFGNTNNTLVGTNTLTITNAISGNPAFESDGYHITSFGAAFDTGVNAGVTTDIDGEPRPQESGPDLGADEVTGPDLEITKTVFPLEAEAGQSITYTLVFTNSGGVTATNVVITDTVPVPTITVGIISAAGVPLTPTNAGPVTYTWDAGPLPPGQGAAITIPARITSSLGSTFIFTNTAVVTGSSGDVDLFNNTGTAPVLVVEPITLTVTITGDTSDVNPGDGLCADSGGACSLRAAIQEVNALPGIAATIAFSISGAGPHTISPGSALPTVLEPVTIDGLTQPGASCAAWPPTLIIEIDGSGAAGASGVTIDAGHSVVRGLVVNNFDGSGIHLSSGGNNRFECNFVGTDPSGTLDRGNSGDGIRIDTNSSDNVIGGPSTTARNLVSGNGTGGLYIGGSVALSNTVQGNYIGTNVSATAALLNGLDGIRIENAPGNIIGGAAAGAGNLIAGNGENGIFIDGAGSAGNYIQGNIIGQNSVSNGQNGILIIDSANTIIGGDSASNTIAYNNADGVQIITGTNNTILTNAIHSNADLGVDLNGDGVTPNDVGDADSGANLLQNFPLITGVSNNGATVAITGTLNSAAGTLYNLQFFANATCDPSNFGEGEIPLGTDTVLTDGSGSGAFAPVFNFPVALGYGFTAIATGPAGNSSEFSVCTATGISGPNTFDDDNTVNGNCTLREAVIAANLNTPVDACPAGNPGPDVITLNSGTYNLTIGGANEDAGIIGDLDITEALTISGVTSASTIIDAGLLGDRVFHVISGPANFSDLTIQGGQVNGDGGGIYNNSSTLTLVNTVVISNEAIGGGWGGGLFNDGINGFVTLSRSTVETNGAAEGGGIANLGDLTVISSTLLFNEAITGGGALLNLGIATLNGSSVISNVALNGAGILNIGSLSLSNNDILQNEAGDSGGGIFNQGSDAQIFGTFNAINQNRAAINGGGIANSNLSNLTLSGTVVFSNEAVFNNGGGIYNDSGGRVTLQNSDQIHNNRAGRDGGGIFSADSSSVVSVSNASISENSGEFGGGVLVGDGLFTLNGGQVISNTALKGGGVFVYTSTAVFSQSGGSLIGYNTAITNGGGVYIFEGEFEMDDAQIMGNSAHGTDIYDGGGGLYLNMGRATLRGGQILNNSAWAGAGIAVISPGAALTQTGVVTIANNQADTDAGGLGIRGGAVTLNGARILGNRATAGSGGGLFQQGGTLTINNGCIVRNSDVGVGYSGGVSPVNATGNWWGLSDGPSGNGPGGGDSVSANVDFFGFLTAAPTGCGVVQAPDLFINKTVISPFAQPGEAITYTLAFGNNGGGVARNVVITDLAFTNYLTDLTYFAGGAPVVRTPGVTYSWAVEDLDAGEGGIISITGVISAGTPLGVTIANTATIRTTSPLADLNPTDNTDVVSFTVGLPDIVLILPRDGIAVAEGGVSDSYGVRLARPPTGTVQINITTGGQTSVLPAALTFSTTDWATAQPVDVFAVDDSVPEYFHTGFITHTASSLDGGYNDLLATATATITDNDVAADLEVQKIAPAAVTLGSKVNYTILVTNHGPWPVTNMLITDTLPGANFVGLGANTAPELNYSVQFDPPLAAGGQGGLSAAAVLCNTGGNIFSCAVDDLIPTGIMMLNLELTPAGGSSQLVNTVEAIANELDPGPGPNTDTVTTTVAAAAVDMVMNKQVSTASIVAGRPLTYSLSVTNSGSDTAFGVTVVDPLPAGFAMNGPVVSTQGSCDASDGAISCGLGTMAGLGTAQITFSVAPTLAYNALTVVTNSATVSVGIGGDADSSNNIDNAVILIVPVSVDLAISKQVSSGAVQVGSTLVYTLNVSHSDPGPLGAVTVVDALHSGVTLISAVPSQGSCSGSQTVTCNLGSVAPAGAQIIINVIASNVGVITNTATVFSGHAFDPAPANNTSAPVATTVLPARPDLAVSKIASLEVVTAGNTLLYTVTVTNAPTADPAPAVILTDTLPAEVVFGQAIPDSGSCSQLNGTVLCSLGTIAAGGSRQVALRVIPAVVSVVTNSVTVAPGFGVDLNPLDNSASVGVTVVGIGAVVSPTGSALLTYTDAQGNDTGINAPAGAVTETIRLAFNPVNVSMGPPAGGAFAGHAFTLEAYTHPGNVPLPGYVFSRPVTITVNYSDADVSNVADENDLVLYLLNGVVWTDAAATCSPASIYQRNVAGNQILVAVCHLTEFALFGSSSTPPVYLPLVVKDQ